MALMAPRELEASRNLFRIEIGDHVASLLRHQPRCHEIESARNPKPRPGNNWPPQRSESDVTRSAVLRVTHFSETPRVRDSGAVERLAMSCRPRVCRPSVDRRPPPCQPPMCGGRRPPACARHRPRPVSSIALLGRSSELDAENRMIGHACFPLAMRVVHGPDTRLYARRPERMVESKAVTMGAVPRKLAGVRMATAPQIHPTLALQRCEFVCVVERRASLIEIVESCIQITEQDRRAAEHTLLLKKPVEERPLRIAQRKVECQHLNFAERGADAAVLVASESVRRNACTERFARRHQHRVPLRRRVRDRLVG